MGTLDHLVVRWKLPKLALASVITLLAFSSNSATRGLNPKVSAKPEIPVVGFCDLIHNPKLYDRKEVRVTAIYRLGYEWQDLYCLNCFSAENMASVEFDADFDSCTKKSVRRNLNSFEGTFAVTLIGTLFDSGDSHGYKGAYRFKFLVKCAERVDKLLKDGRSPAVLPQKARDKVARVCTK
jgi:hypothetical protein